MKETNKNTEKIKKEAGFVSYFIFIWLACPEPRFMK